MAWEIKWDHRALKELKTLGKKAQQDILRYLRERIATGASPKRFGKALTGNKAGLWRYRVGQYRIVCHFEDEHCIVLVLRVAHRQSVYKK